MESQKSVEQQEELKETPSPNLANRPKRKNQIKPPGNIKKRVRDFSPEIPVPNPRKAKPPVQKRKVIRDKSNEESFVSNDDVQSDDF